MPGTRELEAAIAAVRAGLSRALQRTGADQITAKHGVDVVTAADVAAEDVMRLLLLERCPEIAIVGEERGGEANEDAYWLIDPICGTRNYASGMPLFCCNLALVQGGVVRVAAVGDGTNGEVYAAAEGGPAFHASRPGRPRLRVRDGSVVALDLAGKPPFAGSPRALGELWARLCCDGRFHVRLLSTTLPFAKVACGDFAAAMLLGNVVDPVHIAAGAALAGSAGATVTDGAGEPWTLRSASFIAAASPALHATLMEAIQSTFGPMG
jgi:myo-inositol-1(or 4)-monophosphatase